MGIKSQRINHLESRSKLIDRMKKEVYGQVKQPILKEPTLHELPNYLESNHVARYLHKSLGEVNHNLKLKCFFTGADCFYVSRVNDRDPRIYPWLGTRDHLVPRRLGIPDQEILNFGTYLPMVFASNIANSTLGIAPLAVKLKIRQWLSTAGYETDRSVESGLNIKWLIIKYLDYFRYEGRYLWSRNWEGGYWNPEMSIPFMNRMFDIEKRFIEMNHAEKNKFIEEFDWQF